MRWRVRCLSSFEPDALRERYAEIPAEARLHSPELATPLRMAAELLLRELLAEYTGADFSCFRFLRTPRGKPYAENAPHFNLSHSGDWLLCAVGDAPVGVDIEVPRKISPALVRRTCTPAEQAFLADHPGCFLQLWTAKEAYLKYLGTGITGDLRNVNTVHDGKISLPGLHCIQTQTENYTATIVFAENDNPGAG